MSYVPHMGYARPHTPGVRRRREDEIHTWRVGHAILASILLTLLLVVLCKGWLGIDAVCRNMFVRS